METETRLTMADFLKQHPVKLTATRTDNNPHMVGGRDMDHWRCTLTHQSKRMVVTFSKGFGHNGARPSIGELLDCLASDAATAENCNGFEDWCSEFGFDTDSRKMFSTYETIGRQAKSLKKLLGPEAYETLLWRTERD